MVRNLRLSDLVKLEKNATFPVANLINKPRVVQKTFEDDNGDIIGSIIVNGTVELIAIFGDKSSRDKVKVMNQLPELLYQDLYLKGYHDIHTFVTDEKFANILVRHFGFEDVVGRALVRRF